MRSRHNAQVNLQRRHFEYIAKIIANLPNSVDHNTVAEHFANWLYQTNPYFKSSKFVQWANGDTRTESEMVREQKAADKAKRLAEREAKARSKAFGGAFSLQEIDQAQKLVAKMGG